MRIHHPSSTTTSSTGWAASLADQVGEWLMGNLNSVAGGGGKPFGEEAKRVLTRSASASSQQCGTTSAEKVELGERVETWMIMMMMMIFHSSSNDKNECSSQSLS